MDSPRHLVETPHFRQKKTAAASKQEARESSIEEAAITVGEVNFLSE